MYSGMHSSVNNLNHVGLWSIQQLVNSQGFVTADTNGMTAREGGVEVVSGNMSGVHWRPPVLPNEEFPFIGYTHPTNNVQDTAGLLVQLPALCSQVTMNWNWAQNLTTKWSANFLARGALDTSSEGVPTARENPVISSPCGAHMSLDGVDLLHTVSASLSIQAGTGNFTNSETNCSQYSFGGAINWTLNVVQQNYKTAGGLGVLPTLREDYEIALPVPGVPTLPSWRLRWGRYLGYSGLVFDTSSQQPVQRTLTFAMQAVRPAAKPSGEYPAIALPGQDWDDVWLGDNMPGVSP